MEANYKGEEVEDARETKEINALLIPFVVVFYSAEDILKDSSLGILRRVWGYFLSRLIEIFTSSPYCHVQCFKNSSPTEPLSTNLVPFWGGRTGVGESRWTDRPWTKAYGLERPLFRGFAYLTRPVSLWANIRWWWNKTRPFPVNCVSDAEYILNMHYTRMDNDDCQTTQFRSIESLESALTPGGHYSDAVQGVMSPSADGRVLGVAFKSNPYTNVFTGDDDHA